MKVRLSKPALSELEAILTGIRAENPLAAARLEARIRRVFERIAQFPKGAQESRTGLASGVFPSCAIHM
jgi:plasmid stabilization system protein ParE